MLRAGERVGVAVSGGIDSVSLLRLMLELRAELGIVVSVVHFNHKLRGAESEGDELFVAALARAHGLEFYCDSDDVAGYAREQKVSLETAARELRYGFFRHLIREGAQGLKPVSDGERLRGPEGPLFHGRHDDSAQINLSQQTDGSQLMHGSHSAASGQSRIDKILTGHTLDDQAETVLMRVIRGAGIRGLAGIHPRIPVEDDNGEICGEIARPLLGLRRRELESYLNEIGQSWREDASNADAKFTRNRIRKLLVPLLEKEFNPAVAETLAELSEIARGEEDYWDNEVAGWMGTGVHWSEPEWARKRAEAASLVQILSAIEPSKIPEVSWLVMNASIDLLWFVGEPVAVQRRIIKAVGDEAGIPLEFKHIEEIARFAVEERGGGKGLSLPLGWRIRKDADHLVFVTPDLRGTAEPGDYEYDLPRKQKVRVAEIGSVFELAAIPADASGYNPDQLLDPESLPGPLKVRNWRAGDRFWPSHTKSPKKIKELLQERHLAQPERKLWPVVMSGDEIIWVKGFAAPARFRAKAGRDAVSIRETAQNDEEE